MHAMAWQRICSYASVYCVCANYKCCIMLSRGPDLENKVSCILYSTCHSMYLKWTYFCNRHMGAISHWEKCRQNNIINSIVSSFIARFVSMSAITNYFLPNLWKCRYHVYWNLSYRLSILKVIFSKSHNFDQRNQGPVVLWRN